MTTTLAALGPNITVDFTNATNPVLKIPFSDVKDAIGWGTAPTLATVNLEPWIAAILQKLTDFNTAATTETHNVVISAPFSGIENRNNTPNRLTYTYSAKVITNGVADTKPDGDNFS